VRLACKATELGVKQIEALLEDDTLPWYDQLCVTVADAGYSNVPFLGPLDRQSNLVTVLRVAANRVFYHQPAVNPDDETSVGHPTWYGEPFKLKDSASISNPKLVRRLVELAEERGIPRSLS